MPGARTHVSMLMLRASPLFGDLPELLPAMDGTDELFPGCIGEPIRGRGTVVEAPHTGGGGDPRGSTDGKVNNLV